MIFLPIVQRELSVAARKGTTYWVRVAAALVALVLGAGILLLHSLKAAAISSLGSGLFQVLTWIGLAAALSAGLFFTSDCLSEEKREGTLGLIFLTDLRGFDVVSGKLLATSLRGFYGLLAVFPVLAITLLMGGVTGAQFGKTSLAVVNALIYSLAAGLVVSAVCRHSQAALGGSFLLLLIVGGGGPLADAIHALVRHRAFAPQWSLTSPVFLFTLAGAWGRNPYWQGLFLNQAVAWVLLLAAGLVLPRSWQEKASRTAGPRARLSYAWRYGGAGRRLALRRKLLPINPVLWLASRERWQSLGTWIIALLVGATFLVMLLLRLPMAAWAIWGGIGGVFLVVVYLGAASQASRFFVEARRNGMIELLLASPLSVVRIVEGQWRALLRATGPPVLLLLLVLSSGGLMSQFQPRGAVQTPLGFPGIGLTAAVSATVNVITTLANLVAIGWFGMWMGLTSRNSNFATLKTLLFVQVVPWFVISFGSGIFLSLVMLPTFLGGASKVGTSLAGWFPVLMVVFSGLLSVIKDAGFVLFARRKLHQALREQASGLVLPARYVVGVMTAPVYPVVSPAGGAVAPPVIPAGS